RRLEHRPAADGCGAISTAQRSFRRQLRDCQRQRRAGQTALHRRRDRNRGSRGADPQRRTQRDSEILRRDDRAPPESRDRQRSRRARSSGGNADAQAASRRPGAADLRSGQARSGAARRQCHVDLPIRRPLSHHPRQGAGQWGRGRRRQRAQPAIQAHDIRGRDRPRTGGDCGRNAAASRRRGPIHGRVGRHRLHLSRRQQRFASRSKSRVTFMYTSSINRIALTGTLLTIVSVAGGCSSIDRLSQIGEQPKLSAIENPTAQPGYKPVQMPMPKPEAVSYNANSLWRNGSRSFFKDQRAHQIGDLLTVTVNITDQANFANETQRNRTSKEDSGVTDFIGSKTLGAQAQKVLPGRLLTADGTTQFDGKGSVQRQESLQTNVAAVVTQVLPNGNLVVEGKQEIRVNFEMRELIVAGVVRPEDIQSDNTIDSTKIAQARI